MTASEFRRLLGWSESKFDKRIVRALDAQRASAARVPGARGDDFPQPLPRDKFAKNGQQKGRREFSTARVTAWLAKNMYLESVQSEVQQRWDGTENPWGKPREVPSAPATSTEMIVGCMREFRKSNDGRVWETSVALEVLAAFKKAELLGEPVKIRPTCNHSFGPCPTIIVEPTQDGRPRVHLVRG